MLGCNLEVSLQLGGLFFKQEFFFTTERYVLQLICYVCFKTENFVPQDNIRFVFHMKVCYNCYN